MPFDFFNLKILNIPQNQGYITRLLIEKNKYMILQ